jgi:hypothetical protein
MLRDRRFWFLLTMTLIVAGAWYLVAHDRASGPYPSNIPGVAGYSPAGYSVEGYSADFVEQDLQHPEKGSVGTLRANLIGEPTGIYRQTIYPDHERITLWLPQAGINRVLDPQSMTWWTPKTQSTISFTVSGPEQPADPFLLGKNASGKFLGRETLDGRQADHWQITEQSPTGAPYVWQYWQDPRLRTILRYDKPGIGTYQLKNILEGRQADIWFIPPEGYRQVPAP